MRQGLLFTSFICLFLASSVSTLAQTTDEESIANDSEAYRFFLRGRYLERKGDIDGAIQSYREASKLDQKSGEILAELASLYARRNRGEEAVTVANESLERDPTNQSAHRILGLIYAARASKEAGTSNDSSLAIQHLEQVSDKLLPDLQLKLTLAKLYLDKDLSNRAIVLLESLRKNAPGFFEAGLLLAKAYEKVGRIPDALTTLERVVEGSRPSLRALQSLGELYGRSGRWNDAVSVYERALDQSHRSAWIKRQLANALLQDGQNERARGVLRELVEMRPNDAVGLSLLSKVELSLGDFEVAERTAKKLIELEGTENTLGIFALADVYSQRREPRRVIDILEPNLRHDRELSSNQTAQLLSRIGFAYEQLNDYMAAIQIYQKGMELIPASFGFGTRLVEAYINSGQFFDARALLERIRDRHPNNLTLISIEARLLGGEGNVEGGVNLLKGSLRTQRNHPTAYLVLASFYTQHKKLKEALELLQSAKSQFPENTAIHFQLGAALEQSNRFEDAEQVFKRVLYDHPKHAATLNYLGYMLADRGIRLQESVNLLERAIKIDPYNGAYLDSLGWVYFKLARFDLAEVMLQRASKQMSWNSVIQDHLGDLMLKLERYTDAITAWENALAGDGEEIERSKIEQKIGNAKNYLDR